MSARRDISHHAAAGDCERIRPGLIGQPANHDLGLVAMAATTIAALVAEPGAPRVRPHTIALASGALVLHSLSRTGGPLCSCNSRLQGHAVFHLLAAAALATSPPR